MRKIAVRVTKSSKSREAFLESIDPDSLTPATLTAFNELATLLLQTRGGQKPGLTDVKPAIDILTKSYPSFTVPANVLRLTYVASLIDVIFEKTLEFKTNPRNFEIMGLLPGVYYGTTATGGDDLLQLANQTINQHLGEIHMVFSLGEQPGFEYDQCRDLLLKESSTLIQAAKDEAPKIAPKFAATLASLKRATIKTPTMAIVQTRSRIVLSYGDLLGIIDLNTSAEGQFIPKEQFKTYLPKLKNFYKEKQKAPDVPANFQLENLRNKEVVMMGVPPRGWSTDRFQTLLRPLGVEMTTTPTYDTKYAFYDPNNTPADKLEYAQSHGIKMIPYQTAISMASTQLRGPESPPPVPRQKPAEPPAAPVKKKKPFKSPGSGKFLWPSSWRT